MAYDDTLYARYLEGKLTEEELKKLIESGEKEELDRIINASKGMSIPGLNKEAKFEELLTSRNENSPTSTINLRRIMSLAASMAILLGCFYWWNIQSGQVSHNAEYGKLASIHLPDDSEVIMNDGSSIHYDQKNWANSRTLSLTGEAFFNVQSGHSFIVKTKHGQVEVLGTQFNVRAWDNNMHVECYEGKVRVTNNDEQKDITAQQSINIVNGKMESKAPISHANPLWTTGISRFYKESISSVFQEIERQYNVQVIMPVDNRPFSGYFDHNNLSSALSQVCDPMGIKFEIETNNLVKISK